MAQLFATHQPQMWALIDTLKPDHSNLKEIFAQVQSISIDYAIMEKLGQTELACIPCDLGWSDVGSWDAVAALNEQAGRSQLGTDKKNIEVAGQGNFVLGQKDKQYSFVGAEDMIVVDTSDALLVVKKGQSQEIRKVVEQLAKENPKLTKEHPFEYRPWGYFEVLRDSEKFKSKVIRVNPHSQISYQSHAKREEHWIVVQGQGEVIIDDKTIPVGPGAHVHIPLQAKHRIRNTSGSPLEFVEVQIGTYFGEDDIVRYQDDYKRI